MCLFSKKEVENKYFYAMVGCHRIAYEEFVETMQNNSGISLKIIVKLKDGKAKNFKIDFEDLASQIQDEKYEKLFIADGWVSDKSSLVK